MILNYFLFGLVILMRVYYFILIIGILISWIPNFNNYLVLRVLRKASDCYMRPFRGILVIGFLDLSPIFGFLLYNYIYYVVSGLII